MCPSAHTHVASRFLHFLMTLSMRLCCRLPDVNKLLLQIIDSTKCLKRLQDWLVFIEQRIDVLATESRIRN